MLDFELPQNNPFTARLKDVCRFNLRMKPAGFPSGFVLNLMSALAASPDSVMFWLPLNRDHFPAPGTIAFLLLLSGIFIKKIMLMHPMTISPGRPVFWEWTDFSQFFVPCIRLLLMSFLQPLFHYTFLIQQDSI